MPGFKLEPEEVLGPRVDALGLSIQRDLVIHGETNQYNWLLVVVLGGPFGTT